MEIAGDGSKPVGEIDCALLCLLVFYFFRQYCRLIIQADQKIPD